MLLKQGICWVGLLFVGTAMFGCGKPATTSPVEKPNTTTSHGHSHDGWWCAEHGVPESACGLCNAELLAEMKSKGDWCAKHDCPDSQCFDCHPERREEFAAQYEAKYGEKPPAMEEHSDHDHEHSEGDNS
jgi:hypothetical protein